MSVAIIPEWLQQEHDEVAVQRLPAWLNKYRQRHWQAFLASGLPTRKNERWKYVDLTFLDANPFVTEVSFDNVDSVNQLIAQHRVSDDAILLAIIDGQFSASYSDVDRLPTGMIATSLVMAANSHPDLLRQYWPHDSDASKYPFAAMNAGMFVDGLFLYVPAQEEISIPVHILSITTSTKAALLQARQLIVLERQAKLNIFAEYISSTESACFTNVVTDFYLNRDAQLEYVKNQAENQQAIHVAHLFVQQQQDSSASFTSVSQGSHFARDDLSVRLLSTGAQCKTAGFYYLQQDEQYIDHHVDVEHQAAHTHSEMLYKGILDKKSKAVFNGRLLVEKDAQKIVAHQANHNILLSPHAEMNSKPELEIYADDVKCKHGATTGQLDEEALFYLRSRGISKEVAREMLLAAFAEEVFACVSNKEWRTKLKNTWSGSVR